jgi:catechol 2,3-dioxygenase-like lactoylglutathione lyase family enzyme
MNIIGPDTLVFGVDNVKDCEQFLLDYGLESVGNGRFESLDGTGVEIRDENDPSLPPALETGSKIRKTIYGVADQATVDAIAEELGKDREVKTLDDGSIESVDDFGFALGFQVTVRKPLTIQGEISNLPGSPVQRAVNDLGVIHHDKPAPKTLSHVVYFVPDSDKAEAFYRDRLGFITTDTFTGVGSFMRPAGTNEHHTLFFLQTPPFLKGVEHFTFHMAGPSEVMQAGTHMVKKGYESFWGPGRHILGSNWFWYFKSPMGCNIEFDADMDLHDDDWTARVMPISEDNSQDFLFKYADKWMPGGGPPPEGGDH